MLLDMLWMIVLCSIEYDISRLHFVSFEFDWQGIKLVSLIAWAKLKAKFVSQIVNCSPNESAAVQEEWGAVQRVIRLAIPFSVGNPQILFALLDKSLPQPVFKLRRTPSFVIES